MIHLAQAILAQVSSSGAAEGVWSPELTGEGQTFRSNGFGPLDLTVMYVMHGSGALE